MFVNIFYLSWSSISISLKFVWLYLRIMLKKFYVDMWSAVLRIRIRFILDFRIRIRFDEADPDPA